MRTSHRTCSANARRRECEAETVGGRVDSRRRRTQPITNGTTWLCRHRRWRGRFGSGTVDRLHAGDTLQKAFFDMERSRVLNRQSVALEAKFNNYSNCCPLAEASTTKGTPHKKNPALWQEGIDALGEPTAFSGLELFNE